MKSLYVVFFFKPFDKLTLIALAWIDKCFFSSRVVRKSIARVLIVMNQKQKENLRKVYKVKSELCCSLALTVESQFNCGVVYFIYRTRSTSPWTFAASGHAPCAEPWRLMRRTWRRPSSCGHHGPSPCANSLSNLRQRRSEPTRERTWRKKNLLWTSCNCVPIWYWRITLEVHKKIRAIFPYHLVVLHLCFAFFTSLNPLGRVMTCVGETETPLNLTYVRILLKHAFIIWRGKLIFGRELTFRLLSTWHVLVLNLGWRPYFQSRLVWYAVYRKFSARRNTPKAFRFQKISCYVKNSKLPLGFRVKCFHF